MPHAALSTVNLYYELHGAPDAPPLVLLHGATDTFRSGWNKQIDPLSKHHRIIGVDLRGHGQSDNPAHALDLRTMADDLRELLDHLGYFAHDEERRADNSSGPVAMCGFSGGASVALFFAVRHNALLDRLILVSNNMQRDEARLARGFWNAARMQREQPGWWRFMQQAHKHTNAATLLHWWEEEDRQRPNFAPAELAHVNTPALVIAGDRDDIIPLDQSLALFRSLPHAQLAVLPGIGHGAPSNPRSADTFAQVVLQFLRQ